MIEHFIFLVVLNMPAHHDDGLPHKEHEKSRQQREDKNGNTECGHLFSESELILVHLAYEHIY